MGGLYPEIFIVNITCSFYPCMESHQYSFQWNDWDAQLSLLPQIVQPSIQKYASTYMTSHINLTTYNNNIKNKDHNYSHVVTRISHQSGMYN